MLRQKNVNRTNINSTAEGSPGGKKTKYETNFLFYLTIQIRKSI